MRCVLAAVAVLTLSLSGCATRGFDDMRERTFPSKKQPVQSCPAPYSANPDNAQAYYTGDPYR